MSARKKATRWVACSSAFVLTMAGLAFTVDRSLAGIFVVLLFLLGLPGLLLSLIDLGKSLRAEHGGNFRATKATWWLTQLQATLGALCAAVGGFGVYAALSDWARAATPTPGLMMVLRLSLIHI